jgi:hypothetical protein
MRIEFDFDEASTGTPRRQVVPCSGYLSYLSWSPFAPRCDESQFPPSRTATPRQARRPSRLAAGELHMSLAENSSNSVGRTGLRPGRLPFVTAVSTGIGRPDRAHVGRAGLLLCEGQRFQTQILTRPAERVAAEPRAVRFDREFRCPFALGDHLRIFKVENSHWRSSKKFGFAMRDFLS